MNTTSFSEQCSIAHQFGEVRGGQRCCMAVHPAPRLSGWTDTLCF